ncbi:hypothetical protein LP420_27055 [Massilia sp. B-10]|nr:hypothetical protein LP420_27055 [Massilia sp. B-10]
MKMLFAFPATLRRSCALLCLLVLCLSAWATPTSPLRFKRLGSLDADELSILALMQDRQGFIWIGTHSGGLYRYNGYQAVKYTSSTLDPTSLPARPRLDPVRRQARQYLGLSTQAKPGPLQPENRRFHAMRRRRARRPSASSSPSSATARTASGWPPGAGSSTSIRPPAPSPSTCTTPMCRAAWPATTSTPSPWTSAAASGPRPGRAGSTICLLKQERIHPLPGRHRRQPRSQAQHRARPALRATAPCGSAPKAAS